MPGIVEIDILLQGEQAQAQAAKTSATLDNIGKAGQSGGNQAAAGLNNLERSMKGASTTAGQAQQIYENVARTQGANSKAAQDLAAAIGIENAASQASVAVHGQVAQSQEKVAGASGKAEGAMGELHKKVVLGQGILSGYETVIEQVLQSFGGLPLPILIALPILNALAGHFLKLGESKKEVMKIDAEQIAASLALVDVQQRELRVSGDLFAALTTIGAESKTYKTRMDELKQSIDNARIAQGDFQQAGAITTTRLMSQGDIVHDVTEFFTILTGKVYDNVRGQQGLNKDVTAAAEALSEQDKRIKPLIETVARYRDETGQSSESVIQWAANVGHLAPEAVAFLRAELEKIEPFITKMTEDLQKLTIPKFEMKNSAEGIEAQAQAVLSGLTAAFDKGLGGTATTTNSFRAAVLALSGLIESLDQSLKRVGGNEAAYNKLLADQFPSVHAAIELHHQLNKEYDDSFKAKEKLTKDIGPQLEMEALRTSIALAKDNFEQKKELIHKEFDFRRSQLRENQQDTVDNLARLYSIEQNTLQAVNLEYIEHYRKLNEERNKDLTRQREFRQKEVIELGQHLAHQRQMREEEEHKFYDTQRKIAIAAGRVTRKEEEDDLKHHLAEIDKLTKQFGRQGFGGLGAGRIDTAQMEALLQKLNQLRAKTGDVTIGIHEVDAAFGSASHSAEQFGKRLDILNGSNTNFIQKLQQMVDWQNVLTQGIHAFTGAIEGAIAGTDHLGRALLVGFFQIISEICITLGTLFILAAAGFIALPGFQWTAGQLAAAGTALLVFGAVMGGIAQKLGQNKADQAGASGASAGSSASSGDTSRPGTQPNIIPFPTSGQSSQTIVVKLDGPGTKQFLKGQEVVFVSDFDGGKNTPKIRKRISKWAKSPYAA